jgi:glyoxalase family protein
MKAPITGLHHVTAAADGPQEDYDFYTGVLALRLIKKTVNHEVPKSYHFFYGDYDGHDGTIMTNFLFRGLPVPKCKPGRGSISEVSYSVPPGSLSFWQKRLARAGFTAEERPVRFGESVLFFRDPAGVPSEVVECKDDPRNPPAIDGVDDTNKIRGFHSVTLISRLPELTLNFFTKLLGFEVADKSGPRTRLAIDGGGPGKWLDLLETSDAPWARFGLGAIHHVAFTMPSVETMERLWAVLGGAGYIVTDLRDRKWFHSMYMTEPGGINIEFSNLSPGFTVDEDIEHLGRGLMLPKQWEPKRAEIEAGLPRLNF